MKVKVKCLECKIDFYVEPNRIKKGVKYCSKQCAGKAQSKRQSGINNPSWGGGKVKCICNGCGVKFWVKPSQIKRGGGKYCSKKCMGKVTSKITSNKIECECIICAKKYWVKPSIAKITKYCSRKCQGEAYSKNNIGKNNPFFGKHHTEDFKQLKSLKYSGVNASCYGRTGNKHPMFGKISPFSGKTHSQESKLKMSISNMGKNMGINNPSYIHGEGSRKYCYQFTGINGVRNRSLAFFNYTCIECGKTNNENKQECGKSLDVHHVYYRKMSCCENELEYESGVRKVDNKLWIRESNGDIHEHEIVGKPEKFAVLCKKCHSKTTTYNRYEWIKHYENIINTKYNGKSFLTKEEYLNYNQT